MTSKEYYLGIDLGSVSTNVVAIDEKGDLKEKLYLRTGGKPISVLLGGMRQIEKRLGSGARIKGVGTTGSGRQLAGVIVGAILLKRNNRPCICDKEQVPDVGTIMEMTGRIRR